MDKILVIRFSALGDVAMTVPVVYSLAKRYPEHQITFMSRGFCKPMFEYMPENVCFKGVDLQNYKGLKGLNLLYKELRNEKYDMVADLHSVLRTHFLDLRFYLAGKKVARIDKGRKQKKELTRFKHKVFHQLPSSFERYRKVFEILGLPLELSFNSIFDAKTIDYAPIANVIGSKGENEKWIGIAPFAKHQGKIYPLQMMEEVIATLANQPNLRIFLFGGGKEEQEQFNIWCQKYAHLTSVAGTFKMPMELKLMSLLDVMVSMDSANMHLASLVHTPVISIWGATHPYAGFMGWGQSEDRAVQVDLPCRPCSVFGQKPCIYGDYRCMTQILPSNVVEKILKFIKD